MSRGLGADEPGYVTRALNFVEGRGLADADRRPSSGRMPGLPILLALLFAILIASQSAVHMVFTSVIRYRIPIESLVLGQAAAGLMWLIDRRG